MATTTQSRQQRRMFRELDKKVADDGVFLYSLEPLKMLQASHSVYGRVQFEQILVRHLQKESIRTALRSTILELEAMHGTSDRVSKAVTVGR